MIYIKICPLSSQVLATDNAHHFDHVGALKSTLEGGMDPKNDANHLTLLLNIALHAADVSNPAKPFETYMRWTNRVLAEVCGTCMWLYVVCVCGVCLSSETQ